MNNDVKMFKLLGVLIFIPLILAFFGKDQFRYPCQDPSNWDKPVCQKPACDVTRTCPEHVFKGQRDPRLGMPPEQSPISQTLAPIGGNSCAK